MKTLFVFLSVLLCSMALFSEKVADLHELNKPHAIECDGEKFYIVDEATVHMYSMKDFKYIGSFGKRGDGPMELVPDSEIPIQIFLLRDSVFLSSRLKAVTFTKTGKPVSETVFHDYYTSIVPFKKNYVVVQLSDYTQNADIYNVILTPDFKIKRKLIAFERPLIGKKNKPGISLPLFTFLSAANEKLYIYNQYHEKEFFIFNTEGKVIKRIKVPLPKIKVTESIKDDILEYLKMSRVYKKYGLKEETLKETVFFREYLPSVKVFKIKDGIIYIMTNEKKGKTFKFVLMDLKGKILKSLFLPVNFYDLFQIGIHTTYCFDKNTYYYLVDNADAETWELHRETFTMDDMKR